MQGLPEKRQRSRINQYDLDRLVIKTYGFVKSTIADEKKHRTATANTILALYDAAEIDYDEDYFVENIYETYDAITGREAWKMTDKNYDLPQVFVY